MEADTPPRVAAYRAERDHSEPGAAHRRGTMWAVGCARLVLHLNHLLPSSGSTLPTPLDNPSDNGRPCSALVVVFGAGRSVGLGAGVFRKRGFSAPGVVGAHGTGQQKPAISVRGERWLVYPVRVAPYPTHSELVSSCFGSGGFGVFSVRVCPGRLGCQHSLGGLLFGCGGALSRAKETLASGWVKRLRSPSPL